MIPQRVRLSRAKGFRLPPNARSVSRPGPFGNPYLVSGAEEAGYRNTPERPRGLSEWCVQLFREWLEGLHPQCRPGVRAKLLARLPELRGKHLACWCELPKPGEPDHCHAAVLIEFVQKLFPVKENA